MRGLINQAEVFCKRHAAAILTVAGSIGVVATSVMAVKATPKAMDILNKAEEEKGEELTVAEKVQVAGPAYIPAVMTGVATIVCIFGAGKFNKEQQAAITSAYALVDTSYKEYKKKVRELYGDETHNEIINAIMVEKAEDMQIRSGYFCTSCDLSVEYNNGEPKLFYDEYSNRYFEATIEQVMNAEYHLNRNYILRGYAVLNELYDFLGLSETEYGDIMGWAPLDEGMYWIEFNHRKVELDNGMVCYILEMPFEPSIDYDEY